MLGVRRYPPQDFMRRLKAYDPELEVWFNRVWGKWMLFRNGHCVMTVQNDDRSYRPLDERVLLALKRADAWVRGRKVLDEIEQHNLEVEMKKDKAFADFIEESAKETRPLFVQQTAKDVGALNVPEEDVRIPDKETLIKQRERREAARPVNYKRKPVSPVSIEQPV